MKTALISAGLLLFTFQSTLAGPSMAVRADLALADPKKLDYSPGWFERLPKSPPWRQPTAEEMKKWPPQPPHVRYDKPPSNIPWPDPVRLTYPPDIFSEALVPPSLGYETPPLQVTCSRIVTGIADLLLAADEVLVAANDTITRCKAMWPIRIRSRRLPPGHPPNVLKSLDGS